MEWVAERRGRRAVQDMMVKVLPAQGTRALSGSLVTIRQVFIYLFFQSRRLTACFHPSAGLLLCLRKAQSTPLAASSLKLCQELKENFEERSATQSSILKREGPRKNHRRGRARKRGLGGGFAVGG